jgi:Ca2+-binding RTX toxin-like protein
VRQRTNRFLTAVGAFVALSLSAATVVLAATIVGDASSDTLTGTEQRDRILARAGDDTVNALGAADLVRSGQGADTVDAGRGRDSVHGGAGNDNLNGGPGCDRVFGGADDDTIDGGPGFSFRRLALAAGSARRAAMFFRCERLFGGLGNDTSSGGPGRDFMSGGRGDDRQSGGAGADKIFANPGRDVSDGGDGRDVLWALARVDVTAIGDAEGDELSGAGGRDLLRVRDGEVDLVHCGEGHDRVLADQFDQVDNDCERVDRRDITSLDQVEDREENQTENPTLD